MKPLHVFFFRLAGILKRTRCQDTSFSIFRSYSRYSVFTGGTLRRALSWQSKQCSIKDKNQNCLAYRRHDTLTVSHWFTSNFKLKKIYYELTTYYLLILKCVYSSFADILLFLSILSDIEVSLLPLTNYTRRPWNNRVCLRKSNKYNLHDDFNMISKQRRPKLDV